MLYKEQLSFMMHYAKVTTFMPRSQPNHTNFPDVSLTLSRLTSAEFHISRFPEIPEKRQPRIHTKTQTDDSYRSVHPWELTIRVIEQQVRECTLLIGWLVFRHVKRARVSSSVLIPPTCKTHFGFSKSDVRSFYIPAKAR